MLRPALVALALLVFPAAAQAAPLTTPCGGRAIAPDKVITGEFGTDLSKSYVMVPFDVPRGTTAIRVKYCWDRPESGSSRHTLDLGLYEPLRWGDRVWGPREFRGWGGSSHPDVTLSAEGFSSEADYVAAAAHRAARQDDARLPAGADPLRPLGGRAGRCRGHPAVRRRRRRQGGLARGDRVRRRPRLRRRALQAGALRPAPGQAQAGLVLGRLPRPRRALGLRQRDDDRAPSTTRSRRSPRAAAGWTS